MSIAIHMPAFRKKRAVLVIIVGWRKTDSAMVVKQRIDQLKKTLELFQGCAIDIWVSTTEFCATIVEAHLKYGAILKIRKAYKRLAKARQVLENEALEEYQIAFISDGDLEYMFDPKACTQSIIDPNKIALEFSKWMDAIIAHPEYTYWFVRWRWQDVPVSDIYPFTPHAPGFPKGIYAVTDQCKGKFILKLKYMEDGARKLMEIKLGGAVARWNGLGFVYDIDTKNYGSQEYNECQDFVEKKFAPDGLKNLFPRGINRGRRIQ